MITVVTPVSPIKSHPDTAILDETLDSIRHHFPSAEIILTFDGIRAEHASRRRDYEEFIRRALWRADHHYGGVCPFVYEEHRHQSGMMRAILDEIRTPLILYVEQDTPLVTDEPIDWDAIASLISSGESNLVRLHHEAHIPTEHKHMMHGEITFGAPQHYPAQFTRTSQWSQRPHIASLAYYRRIMADNFSDNTKCFLEDVMHGAVDNAYRRDGLAGWMQHRLHIYTPHGGNIKRSYHTDGRAGEPKYDADQIW